MKPVDGSMASTIGSHSVTDVINVEYRKALLHGSTSSYDICFPLFDQCGKLARVPWLFSFIILIYMCVQIFFVSFWQFSSYWNKADSQAINIIRKLSMFCYLSEDFVSYDSMKLTFLVLLVSFIVSATVLFSQLSFFHKTHRFLTWTLHPTRFIVEYLSLILIMPSIGLVSTGFQIIITTNNNSAWGYILMGMIFYLYFLAIFAYSYSFTCKSVYLSINPLSSYTSEYFVRLLVFSSLSLGLSRIFTSFSDWSSLILIASHCFLLIQIMFHPLNFSFHEFWVSVFFLSFSVSAISLDIFALVSYFYRELSYKILIIGFPIVFIVSIVIFNVILGRKYNKIISELSSEIESDDTIKFDYLKQIGISENEFIINAYLRIGFKEGLKLFLDWTMIRYIIQNHPTDSMFSTCIYFLSFFPTESRKLNGIFNSFTSRRNLNIVERFQAYQVFRIKILRQSSVSSDANDKISELKSRNAECESICRSFWHLNEIPMSFLDDYSRICRETKSLWLEALRDFPNNVRFYDEYCRFLSECVCEFDEAIRMKNRSNAIEIGKSFSVDYCFRSLIRSFPHYLKKRIVDISGNIISQKSGRHSNSSNERSDRNTFTSSTGELDAEIEESLGKQMYRQSRMRLALHHAVKGKRPISSTCIPTFTYVSLIVGISVFVFAFYIIDEKFETRRTSTYKAGYLKNSLFNAALSNICLMVNSAIFSARLTNTHIIVQAEMADGDDVRTYIPTTDPFLQTSQLLLNHSRDSFHSLLYELSEGAINGDNVYKVAEPIMNKSQKIRYCKGLSRVSDGVEANFKNIFIYLLYLQSRLTGFATGAHMFANDYYCELMLNWNDVSDSSYKLLDSFINEQISKGTEIKEYFNSIRLIIPFCLFFIYCFPVTIFTAIYSIHIKKIFKAFKNIDKAAKDDAASAVLKDSETEETKLMEMRPRIPECALCYIWLLFISILAAFNCYYVLIKAINVNDDISNLNTWYGYSSRRLTSSSFVLHDSLLVVLLNGSLNTPFVSRQDIAARAWKSMLELESMNSYLLLGSPYAPACSGFDTELDRINLQEACTINRSSISQHDIYRCRSATDSIDVLKSMISEVVKMPDKFNGVFGDPNLLHLMHLCNSHLFARLDDTSSRISALISEKCQSLDDFAQIMIILGIGLSALNIIIGHMFSHSLSCAYDVALSMIKRISPINFVNNKELIDLFLNRISSRAQNSDTFSGNVIQKSPDAIFFTSLNAVIEMVNPATSTILGYSPEQFLGKPFTTFFTPDDCEKLEQQLNLIRSGQSAPVHEGRYKCVSDNTTEIPCNVTVMGMMENSSDVHSFVFVLRDETELVKQQQEAEKAKSRSESLLYQILPPDIVVRLNRGEKDISFSVQCASIIFIDIVKFSSYASTLTPFETMTNLFTIFSSFDALAAKRPLITKIKIIGDVYMAAAGLFAPEISPEKPAEELVKFGLDVLQELEDINIKLNANLSVRIGVNTGGPIIAGVLGTDRPVFDIIGDPINVASRLQSTDIPGKIQISQSTYEHIKESSLQIEPRGEVFLKGKGQVMTYFVSPTANLMTFLSASE